MSTDEPIKVLIGIVTYNHLRFIAHCLDSLPASAKHNFVKVVLVDNCSSDGAARFVREHYSWLR